MFATHKWPRPLSRVVRGNHGKLTYVDHARIYAGCTAILLYGQWSHLAVRLVSVWESPSITNWKQRKVKKKELSSMSYMLFTRLPHCKHLVHTQLWNNYCSYGDRNNIELQIVRTLLPYLYCHVFYCIFFFHSEGYFLLQFTLMFSPTQSDSITFPCTLFPRLAFGLTV